MTKYYAGIGSRKTPEHILKIMTKIAKGLDKMDYTLRSGGADGADLAFSDGSTNSEIYLPWKGFNGHRSNLYTIPERAFDIAAEFHPRWGRLKPGVRKLMARNVLQVLGPDLRTPSEFVVCWTPDGSGSGGTGQSLRIANYYRVPIFDLALMPYDELKNGVDNYLEKLSESNRD